MARRQHAISLILLLAYSAGAALGAGAQSFLCLPFNGSARILAEHCACADDPAPATTPDNLADPDSCGPCVDIPLARAEALTKVIRLTEHPHSFSNLPPDLWPAIFPLPPFSRAATVDRCVGPPAFPISISILRC